PRNDELPGDTQVLVSRDDIRITFPAETKTVWGWSAVDEQLNRQQNFVWYVEAPGTVGPKGIMARVYNWHRVPDMKYSSLAEMLRSPERVLGVCGPGMILQCDRKHTSVRVRGRRVMITVKDSATVAELFGMLPDSVRVKRDDDYVGHLTAVRYVEPFVVPLDSQARARRGAEVREYEFSIRRLERAIAPGSRELMVGDSMFFHLEESKCKY